MNCWTKTGNDMALVRSKGYGHHIQAIGFDHYRLSWDSDYKCGGSRIRHTRTMTRDTDEKGARKFAKKWDVTMPEPRA